MTEKKTLELENVLLDQIEKLNDDSIMDDPEKAKILIEKSKSMADLTNAYIDIQNVKLNENRLKLDAVKVAMTAEGYNYQKFLGIEEDKPLKGTGK